MARFPKSLSKQYKYKVETIRPNPKGKEIWVRTTKFFRFKADADKYHKNTVGSRLTRRR